jgi:hypothetical protein
MESSNLMVFCAQSIFGAVVWSGAVTAVIEQAYSDLGKDAPNRLCDVLFMNNEGCIIGLSKKTWF